MVYFQIIIDWNKNGRMDIINWLINNPLETSRRFKLAYLRGFFCFQKEI